MNNPLESELRTVLHLRQHWYSFHSRHNSALFESGVCNEATLRISDQVSPTQTILVYVGVIKVPDIRIDLQQQTLASKVVDNGFYSYINNNKSIEVKTNAAVK